LREGLSSPHGRRGAQWGIFKRLYRPGGDPRAFVDPSGGSADSFALVVADKHKRIVIDAVRERRPPFSPEDVVEEFAALLKTYRVSTAGEFPRELFRKHGVVATGQQQLP
jgi:hypothetical protein